jgi:hypothetical protein
MYLNKLNNSKKLATSKEGDDEMDMMCNNLMKEMFWA